MLRPLMDACGRAWQWLEDLPPRRAWLLIFFAGVIVRMGVSVAGHTYTHLERYEMERTALSMAARGTLADPYLIPTGPTAHVAPAYALLLAAIFWLFGTGIPAEIVKQVVSAAASSAQYAFLPGVVPAFGISRKAGLAAAVAGALLPIKFSTEVRGDWEAPFTALGLLLMMYALARTLRRSRFTIRAGALQGLGWGLTLLCAPGLLPVEAGLLAAGFWFAGRGRPYAYLQYSAALVLVTALCLAPWAWRNERALGAPIYTRSNSGLELNVSNNDMAGPIEPENYIRGVYHKYHPLQNLREAEAVRDMGEVAYNRDRLHRALDWIRNHPQRFAELTALRFLYTWFPYTRVPYRDALEWTMTAGCFLGLAMLWRIDRMGTALLIVCLLTYTPVFYLIHVNPRHRYPVDWIFLVATAFLALVCVERVRASRRIGAPVTTPV